MDAGYVVLAVNHSTTGTTVRVAGAATATATTVNVATIGTNPTVSISRKQARDIPIGSLD